MESDWPPSDDDAFDFDTSKRPRARPTEGGPYDTGEYRRRRGRGEPPEDPYEDLFPETGEARRQATERGDPFDTGEYRARRASRSRHSDLPAAVRRRQFFAVAALVVLFFLVVYLLFLRGDDGGDEEESLPVKALVGQTIVGTLGDNGVDAKLLKRVRKGQIGGFIIASDDEAQVKRDAAELQSAAQEGGNPPVLIMADQEGGSVKRLPGPPDLSPDQMAEQGADVASSEGEKTGQYLAGLGLNVDLAPVLDVAHENTEETISSRTFSDDPAQVGELGTAFATGLQSAGVAATGKHFPGLGLATTNTDFDVVEIRSTTAELDADLEPFRTAIDGGIEMIMVATAVYPDLSGAKPAAFSANVVQNQLRGELGFQGVVITDDLQAPGANAPPGSGAVQALRAGGDLALLARTEGGSVSAFNAAVKAVKEGRLEQETAQAAYDRVVALKQKLGGGSE